jgi:ribosome-interacting GTPase 1
MPNLKITDLKKYLKTKVIRYSKGNNASKDYEESSNIPELIGELKLLYAEVGVKFTNTYRDIHERVYINIVRVYENALSYIEQHDLGEKFKEKAKGISDKSCDIGWGF